MVDGPPPFDFKQDENCGNDWKIWLRSFEIFAQANSIKGARNKVNWMLHYGGAKLQSIYYSLSEKVDSGSGESRKGPLAAGYVKFQPDNEYKQVVNRLNDFFEPKRNISYERLVFRQLKQNKNERIDFFMLRLREQAERCDFGDQLDENIRDQITTGCFSDALRRKILERENESLDNIMKIARIREVVSKQQKTFEYDESKVDNQSTSLHESKEESVCKIDIKRKFPTRRYAPASDSFNGFCGRCGLKGHRSADEKCPARGKTCNRCGRNDHFTRKCFLRNGGDNKAGIKRPNVVEQDANRIAPKMKREEVRLVETETDHGNIEDDYEDIFCIDSEGQNGNKVWCKIGNVDTEVVVDSGTPYNIVDRASWYEVKERSIETVRRQKEIDINFRSYGGHELKFLGMFRAVIATTKKQVLANFYVADEFGKVLLGYETATVLGVLRIGYDDEAKRAEVNAMESKQVERFGKMKGVMIDIPINHEIKGVVQPYRRCPVPLEKLVDEKIDKMLRQGIIERVNGVSKWVSQLTYAPKNEGDIRICVDMRRANTAVDRESHPLPTMDDFLPHLGGARMFSKLDIKQAYHQVD